MTLSAHQQIAAMAAGACVAGMVAWAVLRKPKPTAAEIEQERREWLARVGRITDGSLVDTTTLDGGFVQEQDVPGEPRLLLFQYRIAGVAYEAVQDVSALQERVRDLRVDLPIQVRYDHANPANSIVVAESWCGLRFGRGEVAAEERRY